MLRIVKSVLFFLGIFFLLATLFLSFYLYKAYKSGDMKGYFINLATDKILDKSNLTPTQEQYLKSGDYENLAKDIEENITPEQVNCAVEMVGEERAAELMKNQDPTPQEILKLSKCL